MVPDISGVSGLVEEFPEMAKKLAQKYWPGPLTLVMKSSKRLSPLITMGKNKVGIRIPDHNIALELLKYTGEPLAVTSANISGEDNLLSIEEIITTFEDIADIIIDAGPLRYGSPSTVVDLSVEPPVILREGNIPSENIFKVI
jgi:L-threonylcarbamoyladenylate synthase